MIHQCVICKRYRWRPVVQPMAPLPRERLLPGVSPFQICGVDFAGPLYARTRDDGFEKTYVTFFVCAVTRALHVEIVFDTTAASFLRAYRRFTSRRGIPSAIYSDNAKSFKRAAKEMRRLKTVFRDEEVQNKMANSKVAWKFIPEKAPWWGGFYERFVRTFKSALRKALGRDMVGIDELMTLIIEVEAVVNARPLTYLYGDPDEPQPLTPAAILNGRRGYEAPSMVEPQVGAKMSSTVDVVEELWRNRRKRLMIWWKTWREEYVKELRSAYLTRTAEARTWTEGEVVLLADKNARALWQVGIIETLFRGKDGVARACIIRTVGDRHLRRPVHQILPLEIDVYARPGV